MISTLINHDREFIYKARGFETVYDMNRAIIENFNKVVAPEDDLYILGDLMLGGPDRMKDGLNLIKQLKGKLHIVRGNHCTDIRWEAYHGLYNVVELENSIYLNYKKYHFYLSHYPTITSNNDYDKSLKARLLNICGHSHVQNKWEDIDKGYIYHCELDAHNCMPVLLDNIILDFSKIN